MRHHEKRGSAPDLPALACGNVLPILPAQAGKPAAPGASGAPTGRRRKEPNRWPELEGGATAPAFTLPDHDEKPIKLSDYGCECVIVYFYPAASTPGCTTQACQFRDDLKTFEKAGLAVVGIRPDKPAKQVKFRTKYKLTFPLLTDPDQKLMEAYGAWGEKTMYGKKTVGTIRSTILVGPDGKVQGARYNVRADGHDAKVLEELSEG